MTIHPTAIIDATATIHPSVKIGPYCIIGEHVTIGAQTVLHPHVVISKFTRIGERNQIFQFASIGEDCQDLKYQGEETWLEIGDDNRIREACSIHRGTVQDKGITRVGSRNLFMVNTHIAHDCVIGNDNIVANNVGIAGHVRIGNHVIVGGNSGIHQFCSIDDYSFGQEKEQASKSIYERHQEAANLIKETLQEAEDNTNESEHKVDFDEIDVNLDKLLEEE